MAWDFDVSPPRGAAYPSPDPYAFGNELAGLVGDYQRSIAGSQANQQGQMKLDQARAFSNGVPIDPTTGLPDTKKIAMILAQKGDPEALSRMMPDMLGQYNRAGDAALLGGVGGGAADPSGSTAPQAPPGSFMGALHQVESGGVDKYSNVDPDYPGQPNSRSQGIDQIDVPTWRQFAAKAGVDLAQYPTPMSAPDGVQDRVAAVIPFGRFGPNTRSTLEREFGFTEADKGLPVGELASRFGGGKGTQVASNASDIPMALTDEPRVPPVSAAAGSSIPRSDPSSRTDQMAGIDAALQNGAVPPAGRPAVAAPSGAIPAGPIATAQAAPPQPARAAPVAGAGTVASIVSQAIPDPQRAAQVTANVAKILRIDPTAPLTPEQAQKVATGVLAYVQRSGQARAQVAAPAPQAIQGQPQPPQQPLVPQVPFGGGDPGQAVAKIDQQIQRLSMFTGDQGNDRSGQIAQDRIRNLEQQKNRILEQASPLQVRYPDSLVSPTTGKTIYQAPIPGGGLSPAAIDQAAETYYQTGKFPTGMGRGIQGAGNIQTIMDRAQELHPDEPIENWPVRQQAFAANMAGERTLATRAANFTLAENSASYVMPRVIEASKLVNRTQYPDLNKIIEAAKVGTGDPNMIRFGIAVETLAQAYATALTPVGKSTVSMQDHARDLLDKAWSQGQVEGAVEQMKREISSERQSLNKTRAEFDLPPLKEGDTGDGGGGGAGDQGSGGLPAGWSVKVR